MQSPTLILTNIKRIRGKALLTLSSGEVLGMPRAMLRERPYRSGMPFDSAMHESFIKERAYPFALDKAISLLAVRARTENEIAEALRINAYPESVIARVMARLHDAGYLNDQSYAEEWAVSRAAKGMGSMRIRMELRRKGMRTETIDSALSSLDQDTQLDGALIAARKASKGKNLSLPADRQKVLAALARRGYSFSLAKEALTAIMNET